VPVDFAQRDISKILVVQLRPFGDVLLTTGYLPALKRAFPEAQIDFLVFEPYQAVLRGHPSLSRVITFRRNSTPLFLPLWLHLLWRIRRARYDVVIDQQAGTGSAEVVLASGARHRLGWQGMRYQRFYSLRAVAPRTGYKAVRNLAMVEPLGVAAATPEFHYYIEDDAMSRARAWLTSGNIEPGAPVAFSPGTPVPIRQWSLERYAGLARFVAEKCARPVVVLWAPREEADARRVVALADHPRVALAPPTTLSEAAAFVKHCSLLVCNDCGLKHVAVAIGARTLTLFGPTSPGVWSAQGSIPGHYHLYNRERRGEEGNGFGISVDTAAELVARVLNNTHA
jgi:ADP-heptose:LPS heptosyltransferase